MAWYSSRMRVLGALAVLCASASGQSPRDLRVGHWVRIKGTLDGSGVFQGEEVEILEPKDEQVLIGTVRQVSADRFELLGVPVSTSERTDWRRIRRDQLDGARVKVEGRYRGPRKFSAREISARGAGRPAIEGRIDRLKRSAGRLQLGIMGFEVELSLDGRVSTEDVLGDMPLAPRRDFNTDAERSRDDDDEIRRTLRLSDTVSIGGQLEYKLERKDNVDLDDVRARDRTDHSFSIRTELIWEASEDVYFQTNTRLRGRIRRDEGDGNSTGESLSLSEAYVYWRDAFGSGWDLQLGRQDYDEEREWLYDQNMDALRLIHDRDAFNLELSASTTLSDGSERDEDATNLIAYLSNGKKDQHAAAYVVDRIAGGVSGEHALHLGSRFYGEWLPQNNVWGELAWYTGESGGEAVSAVGFDVGTTWSPEADWLPNLTLGYAFGQGGDSPSNRTKRTFRQTGLQDNNGLWGGVTSFRYYGELFDPELANLGIWTAGLGVRPTEETSLDLVWHRYDQDNVAPFLINTDLRRTPDGVHNDLGWEVDLIYGNRSFQNLNIEMVFGYFSPGAAFPDGDDAWIGKIQLRYLF